MTQGVAMRLCPEQDGTFEFNPPAGAKKVAFRKAD